MFHLECQHEKICVDSISRLFAVRLPQRDLRGGICEGEAPRYFAGTGRFSSSAQCCTTIRPGGAAGRGCRPPL
jgi:hypothetical protein